MNRLRHPELAHPYFYEFFPLAEQVASNFRIDFSYADYFANAREAIEPLCRYLRALAAGAQGQPVFQECRSAGRVPGIRECLGGLHIFLWRNPWDQWWSYKVDSYFDSFNLKVLASRSAPPLFADLRNLLGLESADKDVASPVAQKLDAAGSYMLFFAMWCHAMLEGLPRCDLEINIDSLSNNGDYRAETAARLEAGLVSGIDFSDCMAPVGVYGPQDNAFFDELETRVLDLFVAHGYAQEDIEHMQRLRGEHDPRAGANKPATIESRAEQARLRQVSRRFETELSVALREANRLSIDCSIKEDESKSLEIALETEEAARHSLEATLDSLEATLGAEKTERRRLNAALRAKKAELLKLENSRYWRWGRPIRWVESRILRLLNIT
jgi:hypothetical protein